MVTGTRVLITGASGLTGKYLMRCAPEQYNVCGTWFSHAQSFGYKMDLSKQSSIDEVFKKFQPQIVIHCAAIGSVDYCETHFDEAIDINARGTRRVLQASERYDAKVIFLSSNTVFSGTRPPYREDDVRLPVNVFGRLASYAEDFVSIYSKKWLIVRPILLYGLPRLGGRGNWATRVMDALSNGHMLHIVDDTVTQPTYAEDLARIIWALIPRDEGVYHVAAEGRMSLYDFAMAIADEYTTTTVNVTNRLKASKSGANRFRDLAARPQDTSYDLVKLKKVMERVKQPMPCCVVEGVQKMCNES